MNRLLALARGIDALNERVGRTSLGVVRAAPLISAGYAAVRDGFNRSSNAWLEIQWYLFALIFLLSAGYTLKHNGHVRIDILHGRFSPRLQAWVDVVGGLLFLLPLCGLMIWMGWSDFAASWAVNETSPDSGGLPRWPIKLAIPLGFGLLALQGLAEVIKRAAFLGGFAPQSLENPEEPV